MTVLTKASVPSTQPAAETRVEQLYAEHVAMVWSGLRKLGVPEASIEDAVQDVFLVAHRRLADFEGRSSVKTWLYGIVLRVAKDYRRAQVRQAQRVERLAELLSVSPGSAQLPIRETERREANQALHAILADMDEDERELVLLVDIEEFSVREAAEILHLHIRSCQRRLRLARTAFEKKLALYLQPAGKRR